MDDAVDAAGVVSRIPLSAIVKRTSPIRAERYVIYPRLAEGISRHAGPCRNQDETVRRPGLPDSSYRYVGPPHLAQPSEADVHVRTEAGDRLQLQVAVEVPRV